MTRAVQHVGVPGYQFPTGVMWDGALVFGPLMFRDLQVIRQEIAPLGNHLLHVSFGYGEPMRLRGASPLVRGRTPFLQRGCTEAQVEVSFPQDKWFLPTNRRMLHMIHSHFDGLNGNRFSRVTEKRNHLLLRSNGRSAMFVVAWVLLCSLMWGILSPRSFAVPDVIPRPEHPRPDFERKEWISLNGWWDFDFDPEQGGEKEAWFAAGRRQFSRRILVPFPWESKLSGIGDVSYKGSGWYHREISVPASWKGKRVFLKFGAVDWEAKVWVGSKFVGEHAGGYTPFQFDVTHAVTFGGRDTLTVRAFDVTDPSTPTGKQTGWYTRSSGIWQTVYLEAVGRSYIRQIRITPDIDGEAAIFDLVVYNDKGQEHFDLTVASTDSQFRPVRSKPLLSPGDNTVVIRVKIPEPKLWSPDNPFLYSVKVALSDGRQLEDEVETYFGMRSVSTAKYGDKEYEYIYLNNRPIYLLGALDQSFNPMGIYTFPSDEDAREDIAKTKEFGLNFLRIHILVPEPRLIYWADKLGVLLMCDMPNFSRYDDAAKKNWQMTLVDTIARDFNHPSIFSWCLFNETWGLQKHGTPEGQKWVAEMYELARSLDPTRLVEDNSACNYDHVKTDINSWHFYINDYQQARNHIADFVAKAVPGSSHNYIGDYKQGTEPIINSEYGGISAGMGDKDISWCLKYLTNELRLHEKVCGYIYTELQDIEWEHNGLMDYDRKPKEYGYSDLFPGFTVASIHSPDFVVIDAPPCSTLAPESEFSADIYMSHFSRKKMGAGVLKWKFDGTDGWGEKKEYATGSKPIQFSHYSVTKVDTLAVKMPPHPSVATLAVWVEDDGGSVLARNYINFDVYKEPPPRREFPDEKTCILRFDPGDYMDCAWSSDWPGQYPEKACGLGSGKLLYELNIPDGVDTASIESIELLFEGAARAGLEKVDARMAELPWSRRKPADYPQTDSTKWPTEVTVLVNGVPVEKVPYPDDPADARGVLSHACGKDPGSYGYLTRLTMSGDKLTEILQKAAEQKSLSLSFEVAPDAARKGGFALYGDRMGRYCLDPTVVLKTSKPIDRNAALASEKPVVAVATLEAVKTADRGGERWRFSLTNPGEGWERPDFDDSGWQEGMSGFGHDPGNLPSVQASNIRTDWFTPNIYLRKTFEVAEAASRARLAFSHDEDVEVFLNGTLVLSRKGYIAEYEEAQLSRDHLKSLLVGKNVLAVHCRQTGGGQFIDVGLTLRAEMVR